VKAAPIGGALGGVSIPDEQVSIAPESLGFSSEESADTFFANGTTSNEAIKINSSKVERDLPLKTTGTTEPIRSPPPESDD
jgi:hypothetical protein